MSRCCDLGISSRQVSPEQVSDRISLLANIDEDMRLSDAASVYVLILDIDSFAPEKSLVRNRFLLAPLVKAGEIVNGDQRHDFETGVISVTRFIELEFSILERVI